MERDESMNTRIKAIFCFALGLVVAACNNDDWTDKDPIGETPVAATINAVIAGTGTGVGTRASGTAWTDNDCIGVTVKGEVATSYTNIPFRYDGAGFQPYGENIYFQNNTEQVAFTAYYPYTETASGIITANTDAANQTAETQPEIDFLFASGAMASKASPTVNFIGDAAFFHRMSQLMLTFQEGDGMAFDPELEGYEISGLKMEGTFNTATGIAAATGSTVVPLTIDLTGSVIVNGQCTSSVILFPQKAQDVVLNIYINGNCYETSLPIPENELKAGDSYIFNITVNKKEIRVETSTIRPWSSGGSGEIEVNI